MKPHAPAPPAIPPRTVLPSGGFELGTGQFKFRPLDSEEDTTTVGTPVVKGIAERWEQARRAYWNGDRDKAIALYKDLIRESPGEPDFFGELGNIYHELGEKDLAAQAYYQAALILVEKGEDERAERLLEVIENLSPQLGEKLGSRLKRL